MNKNFIFSIMLSTILLYCSHVTAETPTEFEQTYVFFPFVHAEFRPDVGGHSDLEEFNVEAGSDLVYLLNFNKYRAMAEFFFTNEEFELEQLKIGLDVDAENTLWIGRFQNPIGYWNSNYNHGLHLQTSVHRPGIVEFEDDGGILANLLMGVSIDGQHLTARGGSVNYTLALGQAPTIDDKLKPFSFSSSRNGLQSILKVGFQPDETDPSELGYVISYSTIVGENDTVDYINQTLFGMYSHQSWELARLTASIFLIDNEIHYEAASNANASFAAGYVHVEYDVAPKWITYARFERSYGSENNLYLELFEHHETERNLAGIRYDLTRRQAISTEVSQRIVVDENHTHISMQWSAVFP